MQGERDRAAQAAPGVALGAAVALGPEGDPAPAAVRHEDESVEIRPRDAGAGIRQHAERGCRRMPVVVVEPDPDEPNRRADGGVQPRVLIG
jgi:hypothetical protein